MLLHPFRRCTNPLLSYLHRADPSSESLYEDESFPERELAALVAAKVYYHLGEYNESMTFALGAGKLFSLDKGGEFEDTITGMPRFFGCCTTAITLRTDHLRSKMHRHLHCSVRHASSNLASKLDEPEPTSLDNGLLCERERRHQHERWNDFSHHPVLTVHPPIKISLIPRRDDL